ncbi:DUF2971 domain-containing protein [Priestia megaterium]
MCEDEKWKDKYFELLFPKNISEINTELARELKLKKMPKSLYKYRSLDDKGYSLKSLREGTIRFNPASIMNDPYDSALTLSQDKYRNKITSGDILNDYPILSTKKNWVFNRSQLDEMKSIIPERLYNELMKYESDNILNLEVDDLLDAFLRFYKQGFNEQLYKLIEFIQKQTFITCFTERNDSILMWSHYANNHTGFCLEYDFKKPNNITFNPLIIEYLYPIRYNKELFDLSSYIVENEGSQRISRENVISYAAMIKSDE